MAQLLVSSVYLVPITSDYPTFAAAQLAALPQPDYVPRLIMGTSTPTSPSQEPSATPRLFTSG